MELPERIPGFVVEAGRAVGRDLPSLDAREVIGPWREAIGGPRPIYVRLEADDPAAVAHVQRLSRVGELWLDTPLRDVDEALDLLVAGASRLVVPASGAEPDLVEAIGPSAVLAWDGQTPWVDVQAAALEHGVPVLALIRPPEGAACDAFLVEGEGADLALTRVASAPMPPTEAAPPAPTATDDVGDVGAVSKEAEREAP